MRFSAAGKTRPVHNPYVSVSQTSTEYCEVFGSSINIGAQRPSTMVISVQNRSYGQRDLYYVIKPQVGGVMSTAQFTDGALSGGVGKASTGQVSKIFQASYANNPGAWSETFEIEIREGSATGTLLYLSSPATIYHFGARVWMQNNSGGSYQNTYVNYGPSEKEFNSGLGGYIERQVRWVIYWPSTTYYYGPWVGGGGTAWDMANSTVDASGNAVTATTNSDFTTYWGFNNSWDGQFFAHYNGTSLVRDGLNEGLEYFRVQVRLNPAFSGTLVAQGPICSIATNTAASST